MQTTKIQTSVQTYIENFGHGYPAIPAIVALNNQGITVYPGSKPDHDFGPDGDRTPDIFLERRPKAWAINVSPDSADISVMVNVFDNGGVTVKTADGRLVHLEYPTEIDR